jgi:hypothetical protein
MITMNAARADVGRLLAAVDRVRRLTQPFEHVRRQLEMVDRLRRPFEGMHRHMDATRRLLDLAHTQMGGAQSVLMDADWEGEPEGAEPAQLLYANIPFNALDPEGNYRSWFEAEFQVAFDSDHGIDPDDIRERAKSRWNEGGLVRPVILKHWLAAVAERDARARRMN